VGSGKDYSLRGERTVGGKAAQSTGAEAKPNSTTPASVGAVVGEVFEEYAEEERADHIDAECGNRYACHLRRQHGDQIAESGADTAADGNQSDVGPR